jgi:hypothetical protein
MGILGLKADERVAGVGFTPDSLSVALMDGPSLCPWLGIRAFSTLQQSNSTTGRLPAVVMAYIGPIWTKT